MLKKLKVSLPILLLAVALAVTLIAPVEASDWDDGTFVATAVGYGGELELEVVIADGNITDITILEHEETESIAETPFENIPAQIIEEQDTENVDVVTGATETSKAIISAVNSALEKAGDEKVDPDTEEADEAARDDLTAEYREPPAEWDEEQDVIVVGGGFAGLAAAHRAEVEGADTLLIDKMPILGGNSHINGGVYASYKSEKFDMHSKLGYEDSPEDHIQDTIEGGDELSDPALVKNMVYGAPYFLDMMIENGLELREMLTRTGGHSNARTFTTENQIGADIVEVQIELVEEAGVDIQTGSKMIDLYRESPHSGEVVGLKVRDENTGEYRNLRARQGIVLATGGFSNDLEMRQKHIPWLQEDTPSTNHVGATGEGIQIAQEVGANTLHMSEIQLYPFARPEDGVLDSHAVIPFNGPGDGIVYVDVEGNRFVNELEGRDVNSMAAMESEGFPTFAIFNAEMLERFTTKEDVQEGIEDGRIMEAETLEDLAAQINDRAYIEAATGEEHAVDMPGESLVDTIEQHNQYIAEGEDPDFNKDIPEDMVKMEEGPYYAIAYWPSVHHTMGGLDINPHTQVLDIYGDPIPSLYAAGEIVGGIHGNNRLGSNAIPDAAAHGIIAGSQAVGAELPEFVPEENRNITDY